MARSARAMGRMAMDPSALQRPVKPGTARRAMGYARPYVGTLLLFLIVVIANASIAIANPLIYREIVNVGILTGNTTLIVQLALLVAVVGLVDAALGLAQTYLAARIGAEVVTSLRSKLFVHIQQMPIAFFGRVQTGALVNRLVTDATGARSAFTDVLSNVVGNSITVIVIIIAMFALSWRITLVALLLLPLFMLPARLWGRRIQAITREGYDAGAAMSSVMVERFNVAGALLSRLFGRPQEDARAFEQRSQQLSQVGIKGALYGRMFGTMLLLMATVATAVCYGWGGVLAARHMLDLGTVVAFVALLGRMYFPLMGLSNVQVSVMTTLVSFERIFEVLDLKPMITEKPGAVAVPPGPLSVRFEHVSFRYPTAAEVSLASLESIAVPERKAAAAHSARGHRLHGGGRAARRARGSFGRRQVHAHDADPAALRRAGRRGAAERRGRSGRDAGIRAAARRRGHAGRASLPRHPAREFDLCAPRCRGCGHPRRATRRADPGGGRGASERPRHHGRRARLPFLRR